MNAMIYIRGNADDFDGWADKGAPGWSYREMLPYFIRSECNERGDPRYHGRSGPLAVQPFDLKRRRGWRVPFNARR
jgi:choline dehydrogenase